MPESLLEPPVDLVDFASKQHRIQYLVDTFGKYVAGRTLDVGCESRHLHKMRPDLDYTGIDLFGEPDVRINLEQVDRLPFGDAEFDTVVCCDVLEHLNNLHATFGELVRVTRKHLIISLPNCWTAARGRIDSGAGSIGHYGLSAEPPGDRHKWFFSLTEGQNFVRDIAPRSGLELLEMRVAERPRPVVVRALRRLRHPARERYLNRYAHTLWAVYAKRG